MSSLPSWYSTYAQDIQDAANLYNVDPALIAAVISQESGGNPDAVSPAGANGLMQVVGGPFDPRASIMAGTSYLHDQLATFGGNVSLALAAYNAGPGAVQKYGGIPPYAETQRYVPLVLGYFDQLKGLISGKVTTGGNQTQGVTAQEANTPIQPTVIAKAQTILEAIAAVPATLGAGINNLVAFGTFLQQPHLWERLGLIAVGLLLLLVGLAVFALSFMPGNSVGKLPGVANVAELAAL